MTTIHQLYSRAVVSDELQPDHARLHFFNEEEHTYISIPAEDVTERERALLSAMYTAVEPAMHQPQQSIAEQQWHDFLLVGGECPPVKSERVRLLHVRLAGEDDGSMYEAADTFFDHALLMVRMGPGQYVLIEEESDYPIEAEEIKTFLDVLAGDFYVSGRLFMGRFSAAAASLQNVYRRESEMAQRAATLVPEQKWATVEGVIPHLLLAQSKEVLLRFFAEEENVFQEEADLRDTLQTFIQNNLNVSQTAKQLHLHRNSLQYRIDRFIARTGIDVRSYEGALLVYMLCLMSSKKD